MKKLALIIIILLINYKVGYCQVNNTLQNDTVVHINKIVELIEKESLDTLILEKVAVSFDTLSFTFSPVEKITYTDTIPSRVHVFYNEKGIRKMHVEATRYYFENEKLIMTHFICMSGAHMGLCNGLHSEYSNYFISNNFYLTVEGLGLGQCPCSDNIIIDAPSIEKIKILFNQLK